jgi:hypothetical protein
MVKKLALMVAVAFLASNVQAQTADAVKDAGKATAEATKEGADKAKAATESGPKKLVDKTKGAVHGAKAKHYRKKASKEADAAAKP